MYIIATDVQVYNIKIKNVYMYMYIIATVKYTCTGI